MAIAPGGACILSIKSTATTSVDDPNRIVQGVEWTMTIQVTPSYAAGMTRLIAAQEAAARAVQEFEEEAKPEEDYRSERLDDRWRLWKEILWVLLLARVVSLYSVLWWIELRCRSPPRGQQGAILYV